MERTTLDKLEFEASYFEDEEREGFFIPSMMKRFWAEQLSVLAEIDRLCRKEGIRWFADCGTLLGAVRHGGFIPWDDDLDICMLREDYDRFFKAAEGGLRGGYKLLTLYTEKESDNFIGRVVNDDHIHFKIEDLKQYHGCPYASGVDIFPIDGIAPTEELEEKRRQACMDIVEAGRLFHKEGASSPRARRALAEVERQNHIVLHRKGNMLWKELMLATDRLYAMYPAETAEEVALMVFWAEKGSHRYKRAMFDETVMVPFENTYLPAPARYDEVLRIEYGDYMQVHRDGSAHDYPLYKAQEEMLRRDIDKNPYRFTITADKIEKGRDGRPLKERFKEIFETLMAVHTQVENLSGTDLAGACGQLLEGCSALALSVMTLARERLPGHDEIRTLLEGYRELIDRVDREWGEGSKESLDSSIMGIKGAVGRILADRKKRVLFLPCKAEWWHSMEKEWREAKGDPMNEVCVIHVPYTAGDKMTGVPEVENDDSSLFPEYVDLTELSEYDIGERHPDIIYIQNPFDGWSTVLDVPDGLYSRNLLRFTDQLILLPCFDLDDPVDADDRRTEALKTLIEQPPVLYADKVIVRSEAMRGTYIRRLTELAGNQDYWEAKIQVSEDSGRDSRYRQLHRKPLPSEWAARVSGKKLLLFSINCAFLLEHRGAAVKKIRDAVRTISEASDSLACLFSPTEDTGEVERIDPALWEEYSGVLRGIEDSVIIDEEHLALEYLAYVDAFYGSPGRLAHECSYLGKPVMIMQILE